MAAPISRFETYSAQLPFEQNDSCPLPARPLPRVQVARQSERSNYVTSSRNYNDKKKAHNNQIHNMTSSECSSAKRLEGCNRCHFLAAPGGNRQISMRGAQELGE